MLAMNSNSKGVSLKNPEVTINIELEHHQLNIITYKHLGMGGFPLELKEVYYHFGVRWI